jgi:uncharacterized Ntn-hydrolase superfamily protein
MTFSLIARSADAHLFGMVIASSSPAVAARCAHARSGVGVVATQNITDPALGPQTLSALAQGLDAEAALKRVLDGAPHADYRQVLALGRSGPPAIHSGAHALGTVGQALGLHAAAAGNLLASPEVPAAMVAAFDRATGPFGGRLIAALRAGLERGGEAGPVHSAGLLVVRDVSWPIVDLRVDWSESNPVGDLTSLWDIYSPQVEDYVRRALHPDVSPSFGVPGDP